MTFQPGKLTREKCNRGDVKDLQKRRKSIKGTPTHDGRIKKIMVHGFQGRSNRVGFRAPRVGVGLLRRQMASVIGFNVCSLDIHLLLHAVERAPSGLDVTTGFPCTKLWDCATGH